MIYRWYKVLAFALFLSVVVVHPSFAPIVQWRDVDDPTFSGLIHKLRCKSQYFTLCNEKFGCRPLEEGLNYWSFDIEKLVSCANMPVSKCPHKLLKYSLENANVTENGFQRSLRLASENKRTRVWINIDGAIGKIWSITFSYSSPHFQGGKTISFGTCVSGE